MSKKSVYYEKMNTINWKPIKGFPGYLINEEDQIKSVERIIKVRKGTRKVRGCILSQRIAKEGYIVVNLHRKGVNHRKYLHRLKAQAFVKNPSPKTNLFVNHKNGNKLDNRTENLEWVTHSQNIKYAYQLGLIKSKSSHKGIKVVDKCNQIIYPSISAAYKATNLSYSHFFRVLHGKATNNTCMELMVA